MTGEVRTMVLTLGEGVLSGLERWFTGANFRLPSPSATGEHTDWLFFWIFMLSAFFFVLLMGMTVVFSLRYRRRPGVAPVRSASHNTLLELSWSVIPTILLVWIFFHGFYGYANKVVAPAQATELVISGQKWAWSVTYPNGAQSPESTRARGFNVSPAGYDLRPAAGGGETRFTGVQDVPIFVVPEDYPVKLRMSSVDVIHSFWIPDFRVKFDVMPNRFTSMWFQSPAIDTARAQAMGWKLQRTVTDPQTSQARRVDFKDPEGNQYWYTDHWVFCAEYCGELHSEMAAIIRVVPVAAYQQIVQDWADPFATTGGNLVEVGRILWKTKGCNACHSLDGSKNVGPTWKNMYGYEVDFTNGTRLSPEQMTGDGFANYIREAIYEPAKVIVSGYPNQMQSYLGRINERELEALIVFMRTLSDRAPADPLVPSGSGGTKPEQGDKGEQTGG